MGAARSTCGGVCDRERQDRGRGRARFVDDELQVPPAGQSGGCDPCREHTRSWDDDGPAARLEGGAGSPGTSAPVTPLGGALVAGSRLGRGSVPVPLMCSLMFLLLVASLAYLGSPVQQLVPLGAGKRGAFWSAGALEADPLAGGLLSGMGASRELVVVLAKRRATDALGLQVARRGVGVLVVAGIHPGGAVDAANSLNARAGAECLEVGDQIALVNGVGGDDEAMAEECKRCLSLSLGVRRYHVQPEGL